MTTVLQQLNADLAAVAEDTQRAIVQIKNGRRGAGTGLLVRADGLIVTNAHVVRRRDPTVTLADGRHFHADVVGYDAARDLAVLSVEAEALPALTLREGRTIQPGDWVMGVGHPWGRVGASTGGVIVGVGSHWTWRPLAGKAWVVADVHLRPGHSGCPLVDALGRVVGVGTMIVGPNLGVAVPASAVRALLDQVLRAY